VEEGTVPVNITRLPDTSMLMFESLILLSQKSWVDTSTMMSSGLLPLSMLILSFLRNATGSRLQAALNDPHERISLPSSLHRGD
jgi:hypothetical protein